jgi:diguanylate cyclase (GGDEF)-like protein
MTVSSGSYEASWLCPEPLDRVRVIDMERRLRPVRNLAFGGLGAALVATGHWVGWWTLLPLVVAAVAFMIMGRRAEDRPRPELGIAVAWVASVVLIAVSVSLSGGPESPGLPWLAIPIVTLPARFRLRGVLAGVAITIVALLAVTLGVNVDAVIDNPSDLIFSFALIMAVTCLSVALMRSDVDHRNDAVIDPLTSMLNRNALATRVAELTQQARVSRQPVAMIVADVDSFKAINDEHGHSVGDAVLRDLAYRIRAELRAYDLAYRLGGEEFLILLPGADVEAAAEIASRLQSVVQETELCGLSVTMSFGVGASREGLFDYDEVFEAADQALYTAKHSGRNCVRVADAARAASVQTPPPLAAVG